MPEPSTTSLGDRVEYIANEYGMISRYTIKRDGIDQFEDHLVFENPVEVVDNDNATISITEVFYTETADGIVVIGFYYIVANNTDTEYIDVFTGNESVGDQMIDCPYETGTGSMVSPGKKSLQIGAQSVEITKDVISSVDEVLDLEGDFECQFYFDSNNYDRREDYHFSLRESLDKLE